MLDRRFHCRDVSGGDIAGWVDEVGEGASPELIGTAVLVDPAVGDGALGETLPGGLAEYVVVPVENLIPLEVRTGWSPLPRCRSRTAPPTA